MTYEQADDCANTDGLILTMHLLTGKAAMLNNEVRTLKWLQRRNSQEYDKHIRNKRDEIAALRAQNAK